MRSQMEWGATRLTVASLFCQQVSRTPQSVAVTDWKAQLTYAELNERVNRLAHVLAGAGIERGDRIVILSENRIEYIELELAVAKVGAMAACQNWRQSAEELAYCVNLVAPKMVFVSPRFAERFAPIARGLPPAIIFGDQYEHLLGNASALEPPEAAEPEDGIVILYTSGTTGLPKGAVISQRAMIARAKDAAIDRPCENTDGFVAWPPMFHMASTDQVLATLMRGGKVIVIDGADPDMLIDIIGKEPIGWLVLMPGMIGSVIATLRRTGARAMGIKSVGCMADLVPRHQIAEITSLLQAPFLNSFGSTETGAPPASRGLIPIGVMPNDLAKEQSSFCEIRLVNEGDHEVPDGEPGELVMRSPTLFSGYWNADEVNAEDFRGGWFHMGDVFVRRPNGKLDFVDRRKYLIKSGGENIYPAELERLLLKNPRIADAAVVRKSDPRWGEVPVVFVVRSDPTLSEDDVMAVCRGQIANYKLPKAVFFLGEAELPRSTTGKIQRHELEARLK